VRHRRHARARAAPGRCVPPVRASRTAAAQHRMQPTGGRGASFQPRRLPSVRALPTVVPPVG